VLRDLKERFQGKTLDGFPAVESRAYWDHTRARSPGRPQQQELAIMRVCEHLGNDQAMNFRMEISVFGQQIRVFVT
jgi:hypothetical protein